MAVILTVKLVAEFHWGSTRAHCSPLYLISCYVLNFCGGYRAYFFSQNLVVEFLYDYRIFPIPGKKTLRNGQGNY